MSVSGLSGVCQINCNFIHSKRHFFNASHVDHVLLTHPRLSLLQIEKRNEKIWTTSFRPASHHMMASIDFFYLSHVTHMSQFILFQSIHMYITIYSIWSIRIYMYNVLVLQTTIIELMMVVYATATPSYPRLYVSTSRE